MLGNKRAIAEGVSFYVHGNVVDKAPSNEAPYDSWPAPVRVQFKLETHPLDLFAKAHEVILERRLTPGYDDSVKKVSSFGEEVAHCLFAGAVALVEVPIYEFGVVAIRTPEITPNKKDDTAYLAGIVDERSLL